MSATTRPMTCEDLEPLARDAARAIHPTRHRSTDLRIGQTVSEDPLPDLAPELLDRVRAHLDGCPTCTARLEREHRLDLELSALATGDDSPAPSPALERQVLRTYQERFSTATLAAPDRASSFPESGKHRDRLPSPRASGERVRVRGVPLIATAATLGFAAAATALFFARRPPAPPVAVETPPPVAAPLTDERATLSIPGGRAALARPVAEFVPLGWDARVRPIEIGRITRVHLPTAVAAHFGWPLLPDAPEARVAADVLVGEDGTARALRFLPATYTPVSHRKGGVEP